jgi:hypothetical protein
MGYGGAGQPRALPPAVAPPDDLQPAVQPHRQHALGVVDQEAHIRLPAPVVDAALQAVLLDQLQPIFAPSGRLSLAGLGPSR